ncbi:zonular occludens toxin domain-containing protein [Pseudomonas sp. PCH446]
MAKFVTEHGHLGIDILVMGQDLTELHQTWRKRLQRYTRYTKLDMMGKEESFHWASYSNSGRNRFKKTADGTKPYNKKLFPLYQSHRADTQNKGNYKDKRYGIFQTKHKVYGAFFVLMLFYAMYHIYTYFKHPVLLTSLLSMHRFRPLWFRLRPPFLGLWLVRPCLSLLMWRPALSLSQRLLSLILSTILTSTRASMIFVCLALWSASLSQGMTGHGCFSKLM